MQFVNLTPHSITLLRAGRPDEVIPPSGAVARVTFDEIECPAIGGVRTVKRVLGEVTGLPLAGGPYIVSGMVASACPRHDVFSPGDLVRDDEGRVIGCRSLIRSL